MQKVPCSNLNIGSEEAYIGNRATAHFDADHQIDTFNQPIKLLPIPASVPQLVSVKWYI